MEKSAQTGMQFKSIELLDTALKAPQNALSKSLVFQYDISLQHQLRVEENLLIVICSIHINAASLKDDLGNIRASCIFKVDKLSDFYNETENQYDLPEQLVMTANSITISTMRGLMSASFRGTFLHGAVLPLIDPKAIKADASNKEK
ncbi:MAG: hypothetical protein K8F24_03890 [Bacteroidales bacterium]|nr:hypothetical protein [Bacteroidales bacterium]